MNKEALLVVLDANSTMARTLGGDGQLRGRARMQAAKESIRMLLEQKLLHNPKHDFGLVLFGSAETANNLNDQMGGDEYANVSVERSLGPIDLEFFREVQKVEAEGEQHVKGDLLDGLIVGLDMLCRFVGAKKYRKRVFLITDGEKEAKYTATELRGVVETINANDVKLNCITLDFCNDLAEDEDEDEEEGNESPDKDKTKETGESANQIKNRELLLALQEQTGCAIIPAETAIELYQQFKKNEYTTRTKYRGNLQIAADLHVAVQIFTKTKEETLPSLKRYSKNVPENDSADHGKIVIEKTYTEVDDTEQKDVPENMHTKAYNYGK